MAQAKSDSKQIMNAAALVFAEYGYYPNDSHISDVLKKCPSDIIIHQSSGRTWGDFIKVCEDPWGNPYEWNNKCENGLVRNESSGDSCPIFSHISQGEYGITVIGKNDSNDNCSGDDICLGANGHPNYGGGTSTDGPGPGPSASCVTVASSCDQLSVGQCASRAGCSPSDVSCTGNYSASCGIYSDSGACGAQTGCEWTPTAGSCSGSGLSCSTYNTDQTNCSALGCNYAPASCGGGTYSCSQWNGTNSTTCTSGHPGCSWRSQGSKCNGGTLSCSSLNTTHCAAAGCSVAQSSCTGSIPACSTYGSQTTCQNASCDWSGGSSTCQGVFNSSCTTYNANQTACDAARTCLWNASTCTGIAVSCSGLATESSCFAQAGCEWE